MGTNYYKQSKACEACGHRKTSSHIGKSSWGWSFSFRGHYDSPRSYQEWLRELEDPKCEIVNEYGEVISLDDFKELVENKKNDLNHTRMVQGHPVTEKERKHMQENPSNFYRTDDHHSKQCWIDPEGHSFHDGEFC